MCANAQVHEILQTIPSMCVRVRAQTCPTLGDPMDCSLPGSSARGIFQAKILEWVSISYSRGDSRFRDQICVSGVSCIGSRILYQSVVPPGKPVPSMDTS